MFKYYDGTYNCFDDINCNDAALQKCVRFHRVGWSDWCDCCDNKYACLDIWKQRIDTLKQAELMSMRHALNPHALYF